VIRPNCAAVKHIDDISISLIFTSIDIVHPYIRPCMEYVCRVNRHGHVYTSPEKDIECLENSNNKGHRQRSIQRLWHLPYEDRLAGTLQHLGLTTLGERRMRADVIDRKRGSRWRTFLSTVIMWIQLEKSQWSCQNNEPVLVSGNCSLVSAYVWWMSSGICFVTPRGCGCYVCEPVQESSPQFQAEIWALKAQLNQPINEQVQILGKCQSPCIDLCRCPLLLLFSICTPR